MIESKYILFFLGALGAFNGLILGIYLTFFKRKNLSSFFLGCLLLALGIRIGKSVFVYFNPALAKIYLQIGLSACFLIGPALYYFIRSSIEKPVKLPASWKFQIAALLAIIFIAGFLAPYATHPAVWNRYYIRTIYAEWFLYILASGISLRAVFFLYFKNNAAVKGSEKWLLAIFIANVVIFLSFLSALFSANFNHLRLGGYSYFGGALIFSLVLYWMIFRHFYKAKVEDPFAAKPDKYASKKINAADAAVSLEKLQEAMTSRELFKNPNLTLTELAKAVALSPHQLSQLLNDASGKNFATYINEFRINEACKMIEANHPFSLEAIGYEVGFNSKSTFYSSFKKLKGTTPMSYKENLSRTSNLF